MANALGFVLPSEAGSFSPTTLKRKTQQFLRSTSALIPSFQSKFSTQTAFQAQSTKANQNQQVQFLQTQRQVDQYISLRKAQNSNSHQRPQSAIQGFQKPHTKSIEEIDSKLKQNYFDTQSARNGFNKDQNIGNRNTQALYHTQSYPIQRQNQQISQRNIAQSCKFSHQVKQKSNEIVNPDNLNLINEAKPLQKQQQFEFSEKLYKQKVDKNQRPQTAKSINQIRRKLVSQGKQEIEKIQTQETFVNSKLAQEKLQSDTSKNAQVQTLDS